MLYELRTIMITKITNFLEWFLDQKILFVKGQAESIYSEEYVLTLEEDRLELKEWLKSQSEVVSIKDLYKLMVRKEGFYKKPFALVLSSILAYRLDNITKNGKKLNQEEKAMLILFHSFYHIVEVQGDFNNTIRAYLIDLIVIDALYKFDGKVELLKIGIDFLKASSAFKKATPNLKEFAEYHFDLFTGNKSTINRFSDLDPVNNCGPVKPYCVDIEIGRKRSAKKIERYIDSGFQYLSPGQYYNVVNMTFAEWMANINP